MNHATLGIAIALAITTLMIAGMNLSMVQRAHAQLISINIGGSQGPKGDKGDPGPQDPKGDKE